MGKSTEAGSTKSPQGKLFEKRRPARDSIEVQQVNHEGKWQRKRSLEAPLQAVLRQDLPRPGGWFDRASGATAASLYGLTGCFVEWRDGAQDPGNEDAETPAPGTALLAVQTRAKLATKSCYKGSSTKGDALED